MTITTPGDDVFLAAAEMKKADAIKAWPDVGRADANPYTREFQVSTLWLFVHIAFFHVYVCI